MQYEIQGTPFPVVICELKKGEKLVSDSGAMAWMDSCMKMETTSGGIGKAFGRMFSGETMFLNVYEALEDGKIAFGSSFPGEIRKYDITPNQEIIVQKSSVLVCEESVERNVFFHKKISTGLFGGEGFVMTRLSGQGTAFIEIDGSTVEYSLKEGQQIVVDSGYLALMDATCQFSIQSVPGMKNKLLGGEGAFHTVITGPGRVVLQTMPISTIAKSIIPFIPTGK